MFCQIVLHCVPFKLYICFFLHLFVFSDAHITFVCFVLHNFMSYGVSAVFWQLMSLFVQLWLLFQLA